MGVTFIETLLSLLIITSSIALFLTVEHSALKQLSLSLSAIEALK